MANVQDDVAYRIRAELVCCHIYERINDTHELTLEQAQQTRDWHDLCYWGEASARIAEGRCPGYETTPNVCRCPCSGCKHSCRAHQEQEEAAKSCGFIHNRWLDGIYRERRRCIAKAGHTNGKLASDHGPWESAR